MQKLIDTAKLALQEKNQLPFSVYSSVKEQRIFNVPIIKPVLICVLDGCKKLGKKNEIVCPAGNFIFLSNSPMIDMRNIPSDRGYLALLIEFDYTDFDCFLSRQLKTEKYFQGHIESVFRNTLQQFIEWSAFAPPEIWPLRKQEILKLLYYLGYEQVSAIAASPNLVHKLHNIVNTHITDEMSAATLASMLAMSESTLRRKLNAEGTSIQAIKDRAKLGYGLHLVQTSPAPIGHIAEQCGYHSQSRFTDRFKQLFGVTPTALRKTRMND